MKNKKLKLLVAIALGSTVMLVTVGNGCSKRDAFNSLSSVAPALNTVSSSGEEVIDPTVKMVSVVYAKQMLEQLTSCVGLEKPSDATIRVYQQKSGAVSLYGDAGSVTAPMMMATTSIAAEVCNDLIQQEKRVTPHIFVGWALNSSAASSVSGVSSRDITDAISRLSLACWQKAPTNQETNDILALANFESPSRENSALMVCTAILSSLKTILN